MSKNEHTPPPPSSHVGGDTIECTLRAMAQNYAGGHSWDHLDGEACTKAADEIRMLRAGIKRLSDEEELCAETTGEDPFSLVYLAAKLASSETERAEQWRLRRDAEGSRDAACAAADALRMERDEARTALKLAIDHIEHMAAHFSNRGTGYSFESLGEDMPGIKAALNNLRGEE